MREQTESLLSYLKKTSSFCKVNRCCSSCITSFSAIKATIILSYDNENYYLLAFIKGDFHTYRVDRMASVEQGINERQGRKEFEKMDLPAYSKVTFGMYNGKQEQVTMVFHNRMLDTVIDQFGKEVWFSKVDDKHLKVTVTVTDSPQFFAWVFGLGNYGHYHGTG